MFSLRRALSTCLALAVAGCYEPAVDKDELGDALQPPTGLFSDGGTGPGTDGGGGGGCSGTSLTGLHIVVRTTPFGGRYKPKNIGAIWIETASGQYVKTVKRWARRRLPYLTRYNASSGGDVTDAVSGATLTAHQTHDVTWNLAGRDGCEIAAGAYRVAMELTDQDAPGAFATFPFTMGSAPQTLRPTETAQFHDLLLELR